MALQRKKVQHVGYRHCVICLHICNMIQDYLEMFRVTKAHVKLYPFTLALDVKYVSREAFDVVVIISPSCVTTHT